MMMSDDDDYDDTVIVVVVAVVLVKTTTVLFKLNELIYFWPTVPCVGSGQSPLPFILLLPHFPTIYSIF